MTVAGGTSGSGGQILVEGLARWGIDTLFSLPGVHLDALFDALYDWQDRIRVITSRHEQGAAYMACGAAMATGKPAAFAVVPGPGLLNAGAAIATAYACNVPLLCIVGTVVQPLRDQGHGALHELPDQSGVLSRLTKWSARVDSADALPSMIDEAIHRMLSGRTRPVALEVSPEVLAQVVTRPQWTKPPTIEVTEPEPADIAAAAALIQAASAPMIVVGGGARNAGKAVRALAEITGAPVVSRQMGRGIVADDHQLSLLAGAANPLWAKADLVIGIGTRLQQLREWGDDENLRVIRIDLDREEATRIRVPDVAIIGDAARATAALVTALEPMQPASWALDPARRDYQDAIAASIPAQKEYLRAIRDALPSDAIIFDELTQVGHAAKLAMPIERPDTLFTSGYQGTLGYGFATALGAQAVLPDRVVVSINGDGGFMYTMPELASAVHHAIPLIAIVFNDNCFGNVEKIQRRWYRERTIGATLVSPDFVALAQSFGALGLRAHDPAELHAALQEAMAERRPAIIEVPVAKDEMGWVWDLIMPRKVRGMSLDD